MKFQERLVARALTARRPHFRAMLQNVGINQRVLHLNATRQY